MVHISFTPYWHLLLPPARARFIPAHPSFRAIPIGAPVPPYTGYPLDPLFRSRTKRDSSPCVPTLLRPTPGGRRRSVDDPAQLRARDSVPKRGTLYPRRHRAPRTPPIFAYSASKAPRAACGFPACITAGTGEASPFVSHNGWFMVVLHLELLHASFRAWALLRERLEEAGLGALAVPLVTEDLDNVETAAEDVAWLTGYTVRCITRTGPHTVRNVFTALIAKSRSRRPQARGSSSNSHSREPCLRSECPIFGPTNELLVGARARMGYIARPPRGRLPRAPRWMETRGPKCPTPLEEQVDLASVHVVLVQMDPSQIRQHRQTVF